MADQKNTPSQGCSQRNEEWKAIPGYLGYEVSDFGRVRSYRSHGKIKDIPHLLHPYRSRNKNESHRREHVSFPLNGKFSHHSVHRLVLLAFVGPCPDGMECCHNDGNSENNLLENLRWDTSRSNHKDAIVHGVFCTGTKQSNAKFLAHQIDTIRKIYKSGKLTQDQLAIAYGVARSTIYKITHNKTWLHPE